MENSPSAKRALVDWMDDKDWMDGRVRPLIAQIVEKIDDLTRHVAITHVCTRLRYLATKDSVCFVLQNHNLLDFTRVYIRKGDDDRLAIKNVTTTVFEKRSKVLCCLDEHMLVKEIISPRVENFYVMNQLTRNLLHIPIPHVNWKPKEREMFTLLHDDRSGISVYTVLHVWRLPKDHSGSKRAKVGVEVLGFRDNQIVSTWRSIRVQDGLLEWENYLNDYVTIRSREVFWDVRTECYIVKFDLHREELRRVKRPIDNVSRKKDFEMFRILLEDFGHLVLMYTSPKKAMFFLLNNNSKWKHIMNLNHSEDWKKGRNKIPFTHIPFPCSTIIFDSFLLFNKATINGNHELYYCNLKKQIMEPLEGVEYESHHRWVPQMSTFTGREVVRKEVN